MSGAAAKVMVRLTVNGESRRAEVDPRTPLVHLLRDEFELTGTRFGCLTGHCGACTVLLGGRATKACTVLAASVGGDEVVTIEGLAKDGNLHAIQQAFWDQYGFQCGYCTPGMIMAAKALLDHEADPDAAGVRHWMEGNICRCTGYESIVEAVLDAAKARASS